MTARAKCDCLNVCGDDPWLSDGRAAPCASRQREAALQALRQMERGAIAEASDAVLPLFTFDRKTLQTKITAEQCERAALWFSSLAKIKREIAETGGAS